MIELFDAPPKDYGADRCQTYAEVAQALKAHPEKWAKARTAKSRIAAHSVAHRIRSGRLKSFARGGFLAEAITTKDGKHEVWVSYRPGLAVRTQNGGT
ncbi:hypothetical protein [Nocardiopsis synnemataformans]|uniref:hypothetical protein n=1 Tax=Nocardiopsis synnemataformans TaxID=61305 RepID=UPI003EB8BBFD